METRKPKKFVEPHKPKARVRKVKPANVKRSRGKALKPREIAAIDNYFKNGGDMTMAAIDAGYKAPTVFGREIVQDEVNRRRERHARKNGVSEDRVIKELGKMAFASVGDLIEVREDGTAVLNFDDLTQDQRSAITEFSSETVMTGRGEGAIPVVKQRVKFANKLEALSQLARIMGMNQDKTSVKLEADEEVIDALNKARLRTAEGAMKTIEGDYEVVEEEKGEDDGA